jgi:hypothetical protein
MKTLLLLYLTIVLLISCTGSKQSRNEGTKLIDYGYFTIRVPQEWKRVDAKGIDSFVGEIHIDSNTVITFDLGWYANDLSEGSEDYVVRNDSLIVLEKSPIPGAIKPREDYRGKPDSSTLATVTVNQKQYITIDGYKAKLVTPTHTGKGMTGLYIENLWNAGSSNDRFQINGQNLTLKQQQQLITAIKTLKFFEHPDKRKKDNDE